METFILNIQNKAISKDLESYLIKFGSSINLIKLPNSKKINKKEELTEGDFFDIAGMWEGTDISIQNIKNQ